MSDSIRGRRKKILTDKIVSDVSVLFGSSPQRSVTEDRDELDFYFVDDSRQSRPARKGMGEIVATGGIGVPGQRVKLLSDSLESLCRDTGFLGSVQEMEFKWSPGRELWMHQNLRGPLRQEFFLKVIAVLADCEARVLCVAEDIKYPFANQAALSAELDVTQMFIERVEMQCRSSGVGAFIVVDRPGGARKNEDAFLRTCLETIQSGTAYVQPQRILHNLVPTPSHLSRPLQAADLVTGICTSRIAGESEHSPALFKALRPLLACDANSQRCGGIGIKIYPGSQYENLYHWLVGDTVSGPLRGNRPLPAQGQPYFFNEREP